MSPFEERVKVVCLRFQKRFPFLTALLLRAPIELSTAIPTACTNGLHILFNKAFADSLSMETFEFVLAHEVLHIALRHPFRIGNRDAWTYNLAADIVVNGILAHAGFTVPEGVLRLEAIEDRSVEEVYAILLHGRKTRHARLPRRGEAGEAGRDLMDVLPVPRDVSTGESEAARRQWDEGWQHARQLMQQPGQTPGRTMRGISNDDAPPLPWQAILYEFILRDANDYTEFDRRYIHRGLYIEQLAGDSLQLHICIDTSGSIDDVLIGRFFNELQSICASFPFVQVALYFCDVTLYGPYPIDRYSSLPKPMGGGGTDFRPFFAHPAIQDAGDRDLLLYLTDGYGQFPPSPPLQPLLWVVSPDGEKPETFPFGRVLRLV